MHCIGVQYIPPVFVVIPVVHKPFSSHGMSHLLQQYPIVTVNNSLSLLLHLNLLQLQVKVHVCLWRFGVHNWLGIFYLHAVYEVK